MGGLLTRNGAGRVGNFVGAALKGCSLGIDLTGVFVGQTGLGFRGVGRCFIGRRVRPTGFLTKTTGFLNG